MGLGILHCNPTMVGAVVGLSDLDNYRNNWSDHMLMNRFHLVVDKSFFYCRTFLIKIDVLGVVKPKFYIDMDTYFTSQERADILDRGTKIYLNTTPRSTAVLKELTIL